MTIEEMSDEFDNELIKLYETGVTPTPIQLDEYEKSVYLTKAQEAIVDSLYAEYDSTELVRRQLNKLLKNFYDKNLLKVTTLPKYNFFKGYSEYRIYCHSDKDSTTDMYNVKAILNEYIILTTSCGDLVLYVVPVKQDEIIKILKNPFRTANDNRALRIENKFLSAPTLTLLCKDFEDLKSVAYYATYLQNPNPIILTNLEGVSINGTRAKSTSIDLSEDLHRRIIEIAVSMVLTGLNNKKSNKDTQ